MRNEDIENLRMQLESLNKDADEKTMMEEISKDISNSQNAIRNILDETQKHSNKHIEDLGYLKF